MENKILEYLKDHGGCRARTLAFYIQEPPMPVIMKLNEMEEKGLVRRESYSDPANMEYYYKYYIA